MPFQKLFCENQKRGHKLSSCTAKTLMKTVHFYCAFRVWDAILTAHCLYYSIDKKTELIVILGLFDPKAPSKKHSFYIKWPYRLKVFFFILSNCFGARNKGGFKIYISNFYNFRKAGSIQFGIITSDAISALTVHLYVGDGELSEPMKFEDMILSKSQEWTEKYTYLTSTLTASMRSVFFDGAFQKNGKLVEWIIVNH